MGLNYGPTIITDGLTLLLDAADINSYPGSGTVWKDLAQGLTFNSYGTTTSWSTVGGSRAFTFNGSGYWECGSGFSNVNLGGDCTIILWLYEVGHSVRKTIFEKAGTTYASYQQEVAMTWEVGQDISWYSRAIPDYDYANTNACTTNAWNMMAIKMSTGLTSISRTGFYSKNGGSFISAYTSRSNTALIPAGAIRVGTGYAGTVDNGSVSIVSCYNRMLSDAEITQIYNIQKTRFRL
jgi:hypothetical protein